MKALIVVDYQNDFVTGSLGFEKAKDLEGPICAKIEEYLKGAGVELVSPGLKVKYVPNRTAMDQCAALGKAVGDALLARSAQ